MIEEELNQDTLGTLNATFQEMKGVQGSGKETSLRQYFVFIQFQKTSEWQLFGGGDIH